MGSQEASRKSKEKEHQVMMKNLLENFRSYSLLAEEQLLIEARTDDAAAKYPEIAKKREELDGESLLDVLIEADPSGNHKYLMNAARLLQRSMDNAEQTNDYEPFWGKQWPDDAGDNMYSPWGIAKNIAGEISKYHKLQSYIRDHDEKFKDLNKVASYSQLQTVVTGAQNVKIAIAHAKEEKKRESAEAKAGSTVIDDNDHHMVIRPLTKEASCYYGKSTKWCISATRSGNYFDQYTSDGKSFYFLLAKRKDVDDAYKKIAVVVDRDGEIDEYYDSVDDTMTYSHFRDALRQTMIGMNASNQMVSLEEEEPYDKNAILDELEKWKGINGFDFERSEEERDPTQIVQMFSEYVIESYMKDIQELASADTQENPAGTPDEAYEEKLAEHDFDNFYVGLHFPSETGAEYVYWDASTSIDLDNLVERAEGWEAVSDWDEWDEQSLRDLVETILTEVGIWAEETEQDYGDPAVFNIRLETDNGDLDSFENYLNNLNYDDDKISSGLLDAFIETASEVDPPFIRNPAKEEEEKEAARQQTRDAEYWPDPEEKKKQIDLPLQENRFRIKIVKNK